MAITAALELSAISALVLTRLLPVSEKGETAAKIQKDLEPLLEDYWSGAALAEQMERALGDLQANGLVTWLRGKTKRSAPKVALTPDGRRRAFAFLRISELKPKTTWTTLRKIHLPARALGLSASTDALMKAIASDPGFRALVLKQQFHLRAAELPKLDDVLDALAWHLLGFQNAARKFAVKEVKAALFNRALGNGHAADFKKAAGQLLAKRVGARRDDTKELRDAVMRGWIAQNAAPLPTVHVADAEPTLANAAPEDEPDLPVFALRVKAAASSCTTGRYGSNKVFIAHVWMALQSDPMFRKMNLSTFKNYLAQANNARLLDLSRADLVQAMDPADVRESEVQYLNATFHFVRI